MITTARNPHIITAIIAIITRAPSFEEPQNFRNGTPQNCWNHQSQDARARAGATVSASNPVLRCEEVMAIYRVSRSTAYRLLREHGFQVITLPRSGMRR